MKQFGFVRYATERVKERAIDCLLAMYLFRPNAHFELVFFVLVTIMRHAEALDSRYD